MLVDYFKTFGHKPCCFDDTHVFITKLLTTADADKVDVATIIVYHIIESVYIVEKICTLMAIIIKFSHVMNHLEDAMHSLNILPEIMPYK